ncbi:MAG: MBL fold metallo-hydrolase [Candidatus Aminicenantes bacterium]|nr:MBL fold metallo-hydrolase [Candidatus Aminicenantes bacterium]
MKTEMSMTFFGVRGSYPVPGRTTHRYGGNTSSLLFEIGSQAVLFDAGTGILQAGRYLHQRYPEGGRIHLFLSHLHIDHIQGLPFFMPLYNPRLEIVVHCLESSGSNSQQAIEALFLPPYSPITLKGIKAKLTFRPLAMAHAKNFVAIEPGVVVSYVKHDSHPRLGVIIYQLAHDGRRVVYATDVESPDGFEAAICRFIHGADILIHDAQYLDADYINAGNSKKGYGHSTVSMAVRNARQCAIKKLFLFHFNPEYGDQQLEDMLLQARLKFKNTYLAQELKKIKIRR